MNKGILKKAIAKYGINAQVWMAVEECSELINALAKDKRGRVANGDIVTEIADVTIMMKQLAIIYGEVAVNKEIARKMARLEERLNK